MQINQDITSTLYCLKLLHTFLEKKHGNTYTPVLPSIHVGQVNEPDNKATRVV
jgi:hypothetical protein